MVPEDMSDTDYSDVGIDFVSILDRDGYVYTNGVCNGN